MPIVDACAPNVTGYRARTIHVLLKLPHRIACRYRIYDDGWEGAFEVEGPTSGSQARIAGRSVPIYHPLELFICIHENQLPQTSLVSRIR